MKLKETLKARALLLQQVRAFFMARDILEVETPLLSHAIGTDPNLSPIEANYQASEGATKQKMFLQTSPEFAMKRMLAEGSGPIFQICKAFRNGEVGRKHNPEFTMLEWYRPGFDEQQLMDEVAELIKAVLEVGEIERISYRELFQCYLKIDPHQASLSELAAKAKEGIEISFTIDDADTWLDLLYSHLIEPQLTGPTFIYNYPKSQAALAKIEKDETGIEVARRFELVIKGIELANGYFELTDAQEQTRRFEQDQSLRQQRAQPQNPIDENFLAALHKGLPECAGVALGLDRLLMLKIGGQALEDVIPFTMDKA